MGAEKASSIYLLRLFPQQKLQQIAGLPEARQLPVVFLTIGAPTTVVIEAE
ncbi:MAG: hypothetical protein R3E67_04770 [Pseudomonadales bacterium]